MLIQAKTRIYRWENFCDVFDTPGAEEQCNVVYSEVKSFHEIMILAKYVYALLTCFRQYIYPLQTWIPFDLKKPRARIKLAYPAVMSFEFVFNARMALCLCLWTFVARKYLRTLLLLLASVLLVIIYVISRLYIFLLNQCELS